MSAKTNLELVEELQRAARDGDSERYGELIADDVVFRMAGVPDALGGVTRGREAVLEQIRATAGAGQMDVKTVFADDDNVCVVGKLSAERFVGNAYLKPKDVPFSTYECVVYRIEDGRIAESTAYVNWLDPYVQIGLVDAASLAT